MASPGLELLFNSIKSQIKTSQDALIAVLHWELISKGFKCLGNGEEVKSVVSVFIIHTALSMSIFTLDVWKNKKWKAIDNSIYLIKLVSFSNNVSIIDRDNQGF